MILKQEKDVRKVELAAGSLNHDLFVNHGD